KHVAANLLKKVWETWPAGVKLCGCWCAQDLEANAYWEKCGFTAVAFRAGSRQGKNGQQRIHIYWQKRIRSGDTGDPATGGTPHWYPSQTSGGRDERVADRAADPPRNELERCEAGGAAGDR
ncbi:MAG: hypothetical protein AAF328_10795, partial [Planctomycetota bacterium]